MKKIILSIALVVVSGICSAQISYGIQVGANIAFGKATYDDFGLPTVFTNDPKVGVLGGFIVEMPIPIIAGDKLAFRPELNFIQKGSKTNTTLSIYEENSKITLSYIELPLNVVYKLSGRNGNFFFGLGPTVAFGVSGKNKYTDLNNSANNETRSIKFDGKKDNDINGGLGDGKDHLKAFDLGANILAGYKLDMGVFFKLGYTYNFLNINPNDNNSYKNRGFNICAGYMFGGSKSSKKK